MSSEARELKQRLRNLQRYTAYCRDQLHNAEAAANLGRRAEEVANLYERTKAEAEAEETRRRAANTKYVALNPGEACSRCGLRIPSRFSAEDLVEHVGVHGPFHVNAVGIRRLAWSLRTTSYAVERALGRACAQRLLYVDEGQMLRVIPVSVKRMKDAHRSVLITMI